MSNASDWLEGQVRAHLFRTATFTKPTVIACALIKADKGKWAASTAYTSGEYVMPNTPNGRLYKCTTSGTSSGSEPTWPTAVGGTVADGTAVWTEQSVALDTGTFPEVANSGAYVRVARNPLDANWTAASATDGNTDNAADLTWSTATADWGWIWGVYVLDSATYGAGNAWVWIPLNTPQQVLNGNVFQITAGNLDIAIG